MLTLNIQKRKAAHLSALLFQYLAAASRNDRWSVAFWNGQNIEAIV